MDGWMGGWIPHELSILNLRGKDCNPGVIGKSSKRHARTFFHPSIHELTILNVLTAFRCCGKGVGDAHERINVQPKTAPLTPLLYHRSMHACAQTEAKTAVAVSWTAGTGTRYT